MREVQHNNGGTRRLTSMRDRFRREEWNVGFLHQSAEDIVRHGVTQPPRWLPHGGPWRMLADPSCYAGADGSLTVLAEHLDYWVGRGEIWSTVLRPGDDPSAARFRPWLRSNKHLSFPHRIIGDDGTAYFIVECWEAGKLYLWRQTAGAPEIVAPLIDRPAIDAAIWRGPDAWWCFCTFRDDAPNERLHLFHAAHIEGPWLAHPQNPVKCDRASSRSAGPLFVVDGQLIRPAQDCSQTYGGAVVLNVVTRLDHTGFAETPLRRLPPFPDYPDGLHTFCPAGEWTLIDGKRWAMQPLDLVRKLAVGVRTRARRRHDFVFDACAESVAAVTEL